MKDHVLKHAESSHRKLTPDIVEEQPEEVYFQEYTQNNVIEEPQGLILKHNLENFVPCTGSLGTRRNSFADIEDHRNNFAESGDKVEDDMVPVSLIAGIKSQIRSSIEERESDEEISFRHGPNLKRKREESPGLLSKAMMSLPQMISPSKSKRLNSTQDNHEELFNTPRSSAEVKESSLSTERSGRSTRLRSMPAKFS